MVGWALPTKSESVGNAHPTGFSLLLPCSTSDISTSPVTQLPAISGTVPTITGDCVLYADSPLHGEALTRKGANALNREFSCECLDRRPLKLSFFMAAGKQSLAAPPASPSVAIRPAWPPDRSPPSDRSNAYLYEPTPPDGQTEWYSAPNELDGPSAAGSLGNTSIAARNRPS